jgi:hypothetical protein
MFATETELLRLDLRCDRRAPALAREAVRKLQDAGVVPEDAVLLVSELVSSEVLERGCAESSSQGRKTIQLVASHVPDGIRISVDTGANGRLRGPGLLIGRVLRGLAHRWGIAAIDGTPELWAELAY